MEQLSWITVPGDIANLLVGIPASVMVQANNVSDYDAEITYKLIYGVLPTGLTLNSTGEITGTPTYTIPANNYFTTQRYEFIIRAQAPGVTPTDATFAIILSNIVNQDFVWVTPAGDLGTIPADQYYSLRIQTDSASSLAVTYSFISGELPTGMQLLSTGYIQGVPTFLNPIAVDQAQRYRFTVRATNSAGHINDRSFSINVTNVYGPIIRPTTTALGTYFDGSYYNQQLTVTELNPNVIVQWSVKDGNLPPGVTLSSNGLLSGYIQPLELVGAFGPTGFDGEDSIDAVVTTQQEYDYGPYDFNQLNQSLSYDFTIQVFDGANYDLQYYVIEVVSRVGWTADSSNLINDSYLTVDYENVYQPILLNASGTLPTGRQNSYYAFKFDGYDFAHDTITYSITDTAGTFDADPFDPLDRNDLNNGLLGAFDTGGTSISNLPGLILDAQSGWLFGKITPQTEALVNYKFGITVTKEVNGKVYSSRSVRFTLPVLGDVNNVIQWITPTNLGLIDNGSVSELSIVAKSLVGKELTYSLYDYAGVSAKLPQGLSLLPSGEITGRVSFEAFSIDNYSTTFDRGLLTIDRISTFTVLAETADGTASSYQEFTLALNIIDQKPYVNLYLKALPAFDQRQIYTSIVTDTDIFDPNLIYRPTDPWFGVHQDIQMLFLPGLNTETLDAYELAIAQNHWTKKYNFGSIKNAVVLDNNYQVKYEVVYIEVLDPSETDTGVGPALTLDLTNVINYPYIDENGIEHTIAYPNSSENMIKRLEQNVGYADQSSLPPWMTSNQLAPSGSAASFNPPLGFTKAVVLAYTVPGASKLIAYRLKTAGINFSNIDFTVDRYEVDDFYSKYFDPAAGKYYDSTETTFDALPKTNIGTIVAKVTYAVEVPFTEINGRTVDYINKHGGIDGVEIGTLSIGQTLIFAKQEGFLNVGPYEGWVEYFDAYIGDNISTETTEGYDSENYDKFNLVPGYLEKLQGTSDTNQRSGVWQLNIINNIVKLTMIQEVDLYERVQITGGKSYGSAVMFYSEPTLAGQTVPYYAVYRVNKNALQSATTFNAGTTKFFSKRDHYYVPNSQDKYLKFPQYGVFN